MKLSTVKPDENYGFCCLDNDCAGWDAEKRRPGRAQIILNWERWLLKFCLADAEKVGQLLVKAAEESTCLCETNELFSRMPYLRSGGVSTVNPDFIVHNSACASFVQDSVDEFNLDCLACGHKMHCHTKNTVTTI